MNVPAVRSFRLAVAVLPLLLAPALLTASPRREEAVPNPEPEAFQYEPRPFAPDPLSTAGPAGGPRLQAPGTLAAPDGAATDWAQRIDQTWGPSPWTTSSMLNLCDRFWSRIDQSFACFQGLEVNWTALRARARAEIQAGVSRGRFAAIMNHLALALRESHTDVSEQSVNGTALQPGVPLFVVGGWGDNRHFRAGLTPLSDSSLLVYRAAPDHPLGLVPGDIVLGYDGVPWKRLYRELLSAELPLTGWWWGSSSSSWTHSMLMSAGLNWHLFDTIDVVRHATGDTVHLAVAPLNAPASRLDCTEQLPIPGVPMPDYLGTGDAVSWGIVTGTRIGYVYVRAWVGDAGAQFYSAVQTLLSQHQTTGLIFDFRTNYGGNMFLAYDALALLFDDDVSTIGFAQRCGPDHLAMCPSSSAPASAYVIHGTALRDYDRPIAVLVGPGAVSSGDQVAHLLAFHPQARFFGKSTSTAFNAPTSLPLGVAGWSSAYAVADAYRVSAPDDYLTHDELRVDFPVWLEPDDVARGVDTVAEAAIRWINNRAPICEGAYASIEASWPPDHELVSVVVEGVIDPDGDPVSIIATAVAQNEPVNGTGDGDTCPDAAIVDGAARVRRERAGNGGGRLYEVSFTARDGYGAESRGVVPVCVPHDQQHGCVDDGRRHDAMAACADTSSARSSRAASEHDLRAVAGTSASAGLEYQLPRAGWVDIGVYDVAGRRVRTLLREQQAAGTHRIEWSTGGLRPGVYFALIRVNRQALSHTLVITR